MEAEEDQGPGGQVGKVLAVTSLCLVVGQDGEEEGVEALLSSDVLGTFCQRRGQVSCQSFDVLWDRVDVLPGRSVDGPHDEAEEPEEDQAVGRQALGWRSDGHAADAGRKRRERRREGVSRARLTVTDRSPLQRVGLEVPQDQGPPVSVHSTGDHVHVPLQGLVQAGRAPLVLSRGLDHLGERLHGKSLDVVGPVELREPDGHVSRVSGDLHGVSVPRGPLVLLQDVAVVWHGLWHWLGRRPHPHPTRVPLEGHLGDAGDRVGPAIGVEGVTVVPRARDGGVTGQAGGTLQGIIGQKAGDGIDFLGTGQVLGRVGDSVAPRELEEGLSGGRGMHAVASSVAGQRLWKDGGGRVFAQPAHEQGKRRVGVVLDAEGVQIGVALESDGVREWQVLFERHLGRLDLRLRLRLRLRLDRVEVVQVQSEVDPVRRERERRQLCEHTVADVFVRECVPQVANGVLSDELRAVSLAPGSDWELLPGSSPRTRPRGRRTSWHPCLACRSLPRRTSWSSKRW